METKLEYTYYCYQLTGENWRWIHQALMIAYVVDPDKSYRKNYQRIINLFQEIYDSLIIFSIAFIRINYISDHQGLVDPPPIFTGELITIISVFQFRFHFMSPVFLSVRYSEK